MTLRSKIAVLFLGCVLITILALQTPLLSPVRLMAWEKWVNTVAGIGKVGPLNIENDALSQLRALQLENIRLKAEQEDYRRLRQQLGSVTRNDLRSIPALVAAQPVDVFRTEFILNRGAQEGVILGAPVVTQGSILIGFISEMSEHASICKLLTNPTTAIPAEIISEEGSQGLLKGQTYTSVVLTTIPRDVTIQEGQNIITIAQDNTPAGLLIGTVASIVNEKNEAYQSTKVHLPYNTDTIRAVTILVAP